MALIAQYNGPFKGINSSTLPIMIGRDEAQVCDNFILRKNYISTRPTYANFLGPTPDGQGPLVVFPGTQPTAPPALGLYYYVMSLGNLYSVIAGPGNLPVYHLCGAMPNQAFSNYFDFVNVMSSTVFVNGRQNILQVIGNNAPTDLTGGMFGAAYIMELAQTLVIANTFEAGTNYPQRIRWCNAGNITQWDPFTYTGAGWSDLLDASDVITGMFAIGSVGYVLRVNGITQVTPTGNGVQPWYFNHLWASQMGIGQLFNATDTQYGSTAVLFAEDNVYVMTPTAFNSIGDKVIYQIIEDVYTYNANGNTFGRAFVPVSTGITACLVPRLSGNYRYFVYKLFIFNGSASTGVAWTYDMANQNWVRDVYSGIIINQLNYIYNPPVADGLHFTFAGIGGRGINYYDTTNLNCEQPCIYRFKYEQKGDLTYESVSFVGVRYKNIGTASLTIAILSPSNPGGQSQTLVLGDPTKDKLYYNGGIPPQAVADGQSYIAYFSFHPVTDESFQITMGRVGSSGPLQIEQVSVFSESKEESR